jgi:hypothetical protein
LQELKRENSSLLKKELQKDKKNQQQILKNLLLLHPQLKHKQHKHLPHNLKQHQNLHLKINRKKLHHSRLYLVGLIHQQ